LSTQETIICTLFGTDGVRNRVGKLPFTLHELPRLGAAISRWALQTHAHRPRIMIAHDTRVSCSWVSSALESGLLQYPITLRDAHTLPTPAVCLLANIQDDIDCGIIISASHNPHHDNGIKIIRKNGKISADDELLITQFFYDTAPPAIDYDALGSRLPYHTAAQTYIDHIVDLFPHNFLAGKKIVLDCAQGATYIVAQTIFERLGATIHLINNTPNGVNINDSCGALHPEHAAQAVIKHGAIAGFAFDGDGDRVVAIGANGSIHNGDTILALLLDHPRYKDTPQIVGTSMSNHGFAHFLTQRGKTLLRTNVGDKYVAHALEMHNLLLGGEQSGHIIARDYLNTGDGIFTALILLETLSLNGNWNMNTFSPYPQVLINVPVVQKKDLSHPPFSTIIHEYENQLHAGRCVIRYSGTENLLRIMVEDDTLEHATFIGNALSHQLSKVLNQ
jgi:phosphoglucosamine mutase